MLTPDQFSFLLDALYEAAGTPDGWDHFFLQLAGTVSFATAELVVFDAQNRRYGVEANYGMPPEARELYTGRYAAIDEWYLRAKDIVGEGWVGDGRNLCSNSDLVRTEFYSDFIREFGWLHECAAVIEKRASSMSVLTMMREERQPEFSPQEIQAIGTLVPHLKRALHMHRRMIDLHFCKEAESWVLDRVLFGLVLLNRSGQVLLANSMARRMAGDGLIRLSQSGVHAISCRDDARLQAMIRSAAAPLRAGGTLLLNAFDNSPINAIITPIKTKTFSMTPAAALFLVDKGVRQVSHPKLLQSLFALTPAEARLAEQFANGISLTEVADNLRITVATARTQLKSVFRKTGTSRQAELVRLLSLLSPTVRGTD